MDNNNQEKFSFPILKVEEITDFYNKRGYKIDKSVVESTDSDTIVELYCSLCDMLSLIKKEKLKIDFESMKFFSVPQLQDRPVYIFKLFYAIKKFMKETAMIENFSSGDLFAPNPKRTKKILSAVINFYKFKENQKEVYNNSKKMLESSQAMCKEQINKLEKVKINCSKLR
jgi:kinetochore protein Nuf2